MAKQKTEKTKFVSGAELAAFLSMVFLLSDLQGMAGNYRRNYLVDVLLLDAGSVALINTICTIASFVISFFSVMYVDRTPKPGKDKFKPLVTMAAVPFGLFAVLQFWTPSGLSAAAVSLMVAYQVAVTIAYNFTGFFTGQASQIGVVMSPEHKERDGILSLRGVASAIGNSAPLVVVLVMGMLKKPGLISGDGQMYFFSAVLCAAASTIATMVAMRLVKERITYQSKRVNPLVGFADVLKNPYARLVLLSEFLKAFRSLASYMGTFLAAALLGGADKFILFGLPTGVGTFVGMLVVRALLNKLSSKQIYILSGIYSVCANACAFGTGVLAFKHPEVTVYQIIFFVFLFLIGLQYGASNLLPSMFQADILEDLEVKTHKRLDASLGFIIGIGSTCSRTIAEALAPLVLYGDTALNLIKYIQPINDVVQTQTMETKIRLLAVYTLVQGAMMFLGAVPFLFYKLTGAHKADIHAQALALRNELSVPEETAD
ncbi:MAG: MFS transporter [Oscillospiraceae bacterium]|jgi:Na+/melibiose symporter-like transporter|nr:MFS transporter [Oscillospiraceae bacterium]